MRRSRSHRPGSAPRVSWSLVLGAILAFSALATPSAASAAWSARLTATGSTVSAGSLAVVFGGSLPVVSFRNESLSATAAVMISNTTSSATAPPADLQVTFAGPSHPLAMVTNLVVWPVSDSSLCTATATPGAGAVTGTWTTGVTLTVTGLPAGATQAICVRNFVNTRQDAASTTGYQSFAASVQARLILHSFSAQASSSSAVGASLIFPFSTLGNFWYNIEPATDQSRCLDVNGGVDALPGTFIGTYACHTLYASGYANQWFTLSPISGSLVAIRSATTQNLFVSASSAGVVTMQLRNASDSTQSWEPQLVSSGVFQFVNDPTGLCMATVVGLSTALSMATCDGSAGQLFSANQLAVAPPTG